MDDVEAQLRRSLATDPGNFALANNLGVLLCRTGRAAEGVEWFRRAIAGRPADPLGHYNLGNALKLIGRKGEAVQAYRSAVARDQTFAAAYRNLANTLIDLGEIDAAAAANKRATEIWHAPGGVPAGELGNRTTAGKLRHDIEQIEYLGKLGRLATDWQRLADDYRAALAALSEPPVGTHIVDLPEPHRTRLASTYNRLWHGYDAPAIDGDALNPLKRADIEADYERHAPGITYFDDFLKPDALRELRKFCLESTVWFQFKYANGYLGAFWEAGFWCPLLAQISNELRLALPGIFRDHRLRKCWAFKYDSHLSGIPMHADFAAVNVNFWVTPDDANLDADGGGVVVWDKEAPADWGFASYNTNEAAMHEFLKTSGARPIRVPHRQNRVVVFNSDLFHETDRIVFADGYENRRINITLLYGSRGSA